MWCKSVYIWFVVLVLKCCPTTSLLIIAPEDVATGFAAIYGFTPRLIKGNDHRLGFGFRFGNHADLQVLYEIGPQITTNPTQPLKVRSATYRERASRRRPLVDLFLRIGLLKETPYEIDFNTNECNEPR